MSVIITRISCEHMYANLRKRKLKKSSERTRAKGTERKREKMTEECKIDDRRSTWKSVWRACAKFYESRKKNANDRKKGEKKKEEEATTVDNVVHRLPV